MTHDQSRALHLHSPVTLRDGRTGEIIGFYEDSGSVVVQIGPAEILVLPCGRLTVGGNQEVRECAAPRWPSSLSATPAARPHTYRRTVH